MVDVTDLFDAFHRVAAALWREFGASLAEAGEAEIGFDELVDQLEVDLFLPACARRLSEVTGEYVDPDYVAPRMRLADAAGAPFAGAAGVYHSHAFHPPGLEGDVPAAILTADLMTVPREGIRLLVGAGQGPGPFRGRRGHLPVH